MPLESGQSVWRDMLNSYGKQPAAECEHDLSGIMLFVCICVIRAEEQSKREGFEEGVICGLMVELEHRDILGGRVAFTLEQGWDKVCM